MDTVNDILDRLPDLEFTNNFRIRANEKLSALGIEKISQPSVKAPPFPEDITSLSDENLTKYYGLYMAWVGYFKYLMSIRRTDILVVENAMNLLVRYEVGQVGRRKADAERTEDAIALGKLKMSLEVEYITVEGKYSFYESCATALSRDLTRRVNAGSKYS